MKFLRKIYLEIRIYFALYAWERDCYAVKSPHLETLAKLIVRRMH